MLAAVEPRPAYVSFSSEERRILDGQSQKARQIKSKSEAFAVAAVLSVSLGVLSMPIAPILLATTLSSTALGGISIILSGLIMGSYSTQLEKKAQALFFLSAREWGQGSVRFVAPSREISQGLSPVAPSAVAWIPAPPLDLPPPEEVSNQPPAYSSADTIEEFGNPPPYEG